MGLYIRQTSLSAIICHLQKNEREREGLCNKNGILLIGTYEFHLMCVRSQRLEGLKDLLEMIKSAFQSHQGSVLICSDGMHDLQSLRRPLGCFGEPLPVCYHAATPNLISYGVL